MINSDDDHIDQLFDKLIINLDRGLVFKRIFLWVMLTGAFGALVKETKKRKFCIENNIFYTF
jgi:hypothetical protein